MGFKDWGLGLRDATGLLGYKELENQSSPKYQEPAQVPKWSLLRRGRHAGGLRLKVGKDDLKERPDVSELETLEVYWKLAIGGFL